MINNSYDLAQECLIAVVWCFYFKNKWESTNFTISVAIRLKSCLCNALFSTYSSIQFHGRKANCTIEYVNITKWYSVEFARN